MKLARNSNLSEEALREIEAIPVVGLGKTGIIDDNLFSPSAVQLLLSAHREHELLQSYSIENGGRKMISS